jgi:hypothetical protein
MSTKVTSKYEYMLIILIVGLVVDENISVVQPSYTHCFLYFYGLQCFLIIARKAMNADRINK